MAGNLYLVEARLIPGFEGDLLQALESGSLGRGKPYEQELQRALREARVEGTTVRWTETCHCASALAQERVDLDQFFVGLRTRVLGEDDPVPRLPGMPLPRYLRAVAAASSRIGAHPERL